MGLSQARKRWQWAYSAGYLSALVTLLSGFFIRDASGRPVIGFDPFSVAASLVAALLLAGLAFGIQKKSLICGSALLLLIVANGVFIALDENDMQGKELLGTAVAATLVLRGVLGIRMLKKAEKESSDPTALTKA